jgi:hypothetical protein
MRNAIYFFAHQDDEFGVFHQIKKDFNNKSNIFCVYLTSGVIGNDSPKIRNIESAKVLQKLGVQAKNIIFAGAKLGIDDGNLINNLKKAEVYVKKILKKVNGTPKIYFPAWEGGHPDHDSLHAVVSKIVYIKNIQNSAYQFPLYNAYNRYWKFFSVLTPLEENGITIIDNISWLDRIYFLRLIFYYHSQYLSWIGLFPFVLLNYLFIGIQFLQPISLKRVELKPHKGLLYYEKRNFAKWINVSKKIRFFLKN